MPWSTRDIAQIAGITVKAVRHYHAIGLLQEPVRSSNGYKQYGVDHLVSLLRITRLTALDIPLAQIAAITGSSAEPEEALRIVDAELALSIDRLTQVRIDLESILLRESSVDMPPGFGSETDELSEANRALILIYSRLYSPAEMDDLRQLLVEFRDAPADAEFDALPPDADEPTRERIAAHYVPHMRRMIARFPLMLTNRYPWLIESKTGRPRTAAVNAATVGNAVDGLYNTAQLDVMRRLGRLLQEDQDY